MENLKTLHTTNEGFIEEKKNFKKRTPLEKLAIEAAKNGLSYGQLMSLKYKERGRYI